MKKTRLKHRENGKQMNEACLKAWIKEGVNEGLGAYSIQDALEKMFDVGKIKQLLIESLTPEIMNAVTPYYKDEFYSTISGDKLIISPWWDELCQEIKIVDLVKHGVDGHDIEYLTKMKNAFVESLEIIDKNIKEHNIKYE